MAARKKPLRKKATNKPRTRKRTRPRKSAPKRITSWSFSTWKGTDHPKEGCPRATKYKKLDKLPDPSGPAAARGTRAHELLEHYVDFEDAIFPPEFSKFKPMLDKHIAECADIQTEMALFYDRAWEPCPEEQAAFKGFIDLVIIVDDETILVIDYKTGRPRDWHEDQLHCYATFIFHKYPWVKKVIAEDWYLDQGDVDTHTFYRKDAGKMKALWYERGEALLTRETWPAKRNPNCKWCVFNSKKGGPCTEGA